MGLHIFVIIIIILFCVYKKHGGFIYTNLLYFKELSFLFISLVYTLITTWELIRKESNISELKGTTVAARKPAPKQETSTR